MSERASNQNSLKPADASPVPTPAEIDASCRGPLLVLFVSASIWFLVASVFGLIASIKFHSPHFLADIPWLTYGRIQPAGMNALLYGACLQAGFGVAFWLLGRLGRAPLAFQVPVIAGAVFWNLAVTIGCGGILLGDSTGFQMLELPSYSVVNLFLGYVLIGVSAVWMFHARREPLTFASQWFLLAALFWFPWIYSTAELLLVQFPVRGNAQAVIVWWYADNLTVVWLSLVGLAAIFYFIARLTGRDLHSHFLALFAFWVLVLFGSWGGIPGSAPVPAWMPTISAVARVLMLVALIAVGLNVHGTLAGAYAGVKLEPALTFIVFGAGAFLVAGLMRVLGTLLDPSHLLQFTWFEPARIRLHICGFFVLVMLGAIYYIVPRLSGTGFPFPRLVWAHFWLAAAGILAIVVPQAIGGIFECAELANPAVGFVGISRSTLPFLRASTIGESLITLGHLILLLNLAALVTRYYRVRASSAYRTVTADLFKRAEAEA
jgi:cytochrome c oxidase cbb3-type subunit I